MESKLIITFFILLIIIVLSGFAPGVTVVCGTGLLVVTIAYLNKSENGADIGAIFMILVWIFVVLWTVFS